MADQPDAGAQTPITPQRIAREITELSAQRKAGTLTPIAYDQRFARMIGELRERRIDGSRADILAVLTPLKDRGDVTADEWDRLTKQLGLTPR